MLPNQKKKNLGSIVLVQTNQHLKDIISAAKEKYDSAHRTTEQISLTRAHRGVKRKLRAMHTYIFIVLFCTAVRVRVRMFVLV